MDKNTITGIILIILIWVAMTIYNSKQQEKYETIKKQEQLNNPKPDSLAQNIKTKDSGRTQAIDSIAINETSTEDYGVFSAALKGIEQDVVVENEDCIYTFSNKGGILKKVELKKYKTYDQKPLILFNQSATNFNFSFAINATKNTINTENLFFTADNGNKIIQGDETYTIDYKVSDNSGKLYSQTYTIQGTGYVVDFISDISGIAKELPKNTNAITLDWSQQVMSHEKNIKEERMSSGVYYQDTKNNVDDIGLTRDKDAETENPTNWISFSQKFFNTTLITENTPFATKAKIKTIAGTDDSSLLVKNLYAQIQIPMDKNNNYQFKGKLYMGPSSFKELRKVEKGLQNIIPVGGSILGLVNKVLVIPIFNFLHKFISNYGIIILILTIIIKLITLPFTYKSQLSMIKMKVLKPEIDELKAKYKDQATFGAKQMELYQQTGVSPFGGCLPMLLQWPFLIAMYRFFPSAIELRQQKFLWANDLSTYDAVINLPFNIPMLGNHLSLFAILGVATSFGMTLYTMKMQPQQAASGGGEFADAMQKQMKIMQYFFPFMILFFFNSSSSALSYYFFLYNGISLLQQWLMGKFFIDENAIRTQIEFNKKNPKKKSNFQARMEEMMKQQQTLKDQQKKK